MEKVGIIVDSTFYFTKEEVKKYDLGVVQLNVIDGEVSHKEYDLTPEIVYKRQDEGAGLTTSQPSPQEFIDAYTEGFEKGYEKLLVLTLSKGLSGTYQSAALAKKSHERGDDVYLVDTQQAAYGNELLTLLTIEKLKKAKDLEKFVKEIEQMGQDIGLFFTVENLNSLYRGGRLKRSQAFIGTVLRVKPMLTVKEGKLTLFDKSRSYSGVNQKIIDYMKEDQKGKKNLVVRMITINSEDSYAPLKEAVLAAFPNATFSETTYLGPVFSIHVGKKGYGLAWHFE